MKLMTRQYNKFGRWYLFADNKEDRSIPSQYKEEQVEALAKSLYPDHRIITTSDKDHACNDHS